MAKQLSIWQIFKLPIFSFILSLAGILVALLVDGLTDVLASLALASTVGMVAWFVFLRGTRGND
jgi:hypothetical protein